MSTVPPNIDKRSREYKQWLKEQEDNGNVQEDLFLPVNDIVSEHSSVNEVVQQPAISIPQEPINKHIMEPVAKKEVSVQPKVRGIVSIKPFVTDRPNMGLEKYDETLFPGTEQMDSVFVTVKDNIKIYKTGLNEQAVEIQSISDPEEKKAKIRAIRETVAWLENAVGNYKLRPETCMNKYGTDTDQFWEHVETFQSICPDKYDGSGAFKIRIPTYWDKLNIVLTNEGRSFNLKDPHDLAAYHVAQAGGFGMVATSYQQAMEDGGYKFYLHKMEDVAAIKTEPKKLKYKALGYLDTMLTGDTNKLFYMAKLQAVQGSAYYKIGGESATPLDQLYEDIGNDLEGKTPNRSSKEAVEIFLKNYSKPIDDLHTRAIVKDALEMHLIDYKAGQLYYLKMNTPLGKNIEDAVANLQNPIHEETYISVRDTVMTEWKK